ncbi:dihydrolipoyl dehydrogenase [Sinanaerobacter chloroacetimidivorans]|uniref:Dihydrolipoyl dehydrogenase n=1 Tax=Sinanaerobacter chloroacetimidivorans TaxID=2818044 RepID=A0A8J7W3F6_9FIRM|nr:dihydrolipoyl dehydrogenase [Sinanaerobacter chloroacetimidivorans]MBR0598545.1 dihydrolipoyl dehydrogenase [Sinanaerobacter chloroacetimidivorans]
MVKKIDCSIAVLGGGPAGYVAAIRAAQLGAEVVLIEESELGGVCLNSGCIPTKALLKTAETAATIKGAKEFGINGKMENANWDLAVARKDRVVKSLNTGLGQLLDTRGVRIIKGRGTVITINTIFVQTIDEIIEVNCKKMILTTGAVPMKPPIDGIDLDGVITSNEALDLDSLPESIVIIGGGVIGIEFASLLNSLGVKTTIIEQQDTILPFEDKEIVTELLKIMKRQGIAFKLSALVSEIQKTENGLAVVYSVGGKSSIQVCEKVLVAVGRKLNSDIFQNLPLHIKKGAIVVDENMETNIKGVYAAGDLTGGKLLAHLAFMEGKTAAENALGMSSKVNYNAVPSCIYTNPEVASVGLTEEEAKQAGISVKVGRFNFRNNGRALTLGEREGFVKVVADQENTIIGGQILGADASEMISELTLAITLKARADTLADMIHPHPSLSEAIWEACADVAGRAIHK